MDEIELPLVHVLRGMEEAGVRLNVARLQEVRDRVRAEVRDLEDEIFALADTEFVIGSPQQLGEVLFNKLGLSKKRRGKTGFSTDARVLQAIRDEHPVVPEDRALARAQPAHEDLSRGAARPRRLARRASTRRSTRRWRSTGRLSSTNPNMQNVPIRTALGREIRNCFEAEEGNVLHQRRLLAGRAAGARARRRRGRAEGDLQARRGRPHRDRARGLRQVPRTRSTRACARSRR